MYNLDFYKKEKENILENVFFSKRQKIILDKLILGFNNKEIQKDIGCSIRTIQYEIKKIKEKIENYRNNGNNEIFCVYIHLFPNGKKYIGVTESIIQRWGTSGLPYSKNIKMYEDIVKYGWENIRHEILLKTSSEYKARNLENKLIKIFDLTNEENGYNLME